MPTVFYREGNITFHRSRDCVKLLQKCRPGGTPHPVQARDLAELEKARPCRTCYPDAPRAKVAYRHCPKCNKKYVKACPHNGGVPVTIAFQTKYVGLLRDPGEVGFKTIYVWPDRAHLYADLTTV